ncbi:hypothetical protein DKE44_012460 [Acinetobacter nosocomialis]|nr:hypothetical protein DKC18_012345 [Acinetobacter nosocomialis]AZC06363.1 hypothetical protein DKE44_012460 [Acinetobacter nosocomialis]
MIKPIIKFLLILKLKISLKVYYRKVSRARAFYVQNKMLTRFHLTFCAQIKKDHILQQNNAAFFNS